VNRPSAEVAAESAAPAQRDRFIPLRKSDIIDGLVAEGRLDAAGQARLQQFARMLGAIFHYQYFEELDRLREAYFHFDPEVDPPKHVPAKWNPVRRQGHASTVESTAFPVDIGSRSEPISTGNAEVAAATQSSRSGGTTASAGGAKPRPSRAIA